MIVTQSTAERNDEIIRDFSRIKPLLEKGHTYCSACKLLFGSTYVRSSKYKSIREYGKSLGYSPVKKSKYGIVNVCLYKSKLSRTGYRWTFVCLSEKGKPTYITSYDLVKLHEKVEKRGLDWVVDDIAKANETYSMNRKMLENIRESQPKGPKSKPIRNKNNTSGVLRVHKSKRRDCSNGFTWRYQYYTDGKIKAITNVSGRILKEKVLKKGLDWIVVNEDIARENGLL